MQERIQRVEAVIGRLAPSQHPLVSRALDEDFEGTMLLAGELAGSNAHRPVGVFINALRLGEHKRRIGSQAAPRRYARPEPPSAEQMAAAAALALEWRRVYSIIETYPDARAMFHQFQQDCDDSWLEQRGFEDDDRTPRMVWNCNPTREEGRRCREALLAYADYQESLDGGSPTPHVPFTLRSFPGDGPDAAEDE